MGPGKTASTGQELLDGEMSDALAKTSCKVVRALGPPLADICEIREGT